MNPHILPMLEGTFSLDVAHLIIKTITQTFNYKEDTSVYCFFLFFFFFFVFFFFFCFFFFFFVFGFVFVYFFSEITIKKNKTMFITDYNL